MSDHYRELYHQGMLERKELLATIKQLEQDKEYFNTKTHVAVPRKLVGFLLGENKYKGYGFGDKPPLIAGKYKAQYWWRRLIREAMLSAQETEE